MKSIFLLIIASAFSYSCYSQTAETTVESKVQFGHYFYYFLKSKTGNDIYKTSAFYIDELSVGQDINLAERIIEDEFDIVEPITQHPSIARKIKNNGNSLQARIERLDLPVLENEILFFRDTTHLYSFYDQINDIEEHLPYSIGEFDDVLDAFEENYTGYFSFREFILDKYGDEMTDEEFLAFEEEDFIADRIHRSIFNSNRLIGINDRVYYHHDFNEIVSTNKENIEEIELFKELSVDANSSIYKSDVFMNFNIEYEPNEERRFQRWNSFAEWEAELLSVVRNDSVEEKGVTIIETIDGPFTFQTIPMEHPIINNCDPFTKGISIDEVIITFNFEQVPNANIINGFTLIVNWGDGQIETFTNYTLQTIVTHAYAQNLSSPVEPETELVINTVSGDVSVFDGKEFLAGTPYEFSFDFVACTQAEKANWRHTEIGSWRLRSKIWFQSNVFGRHVGSYSHGYKKQNNGNWKRKKSKIRTTISGDIRIDDCTFDDNKSGQRNKNNAKKAKRSKSFLLHKDRRSLSNGDVTSTHRLVKGGITINANMVLNPCP